MGFPLDPPIAHSFVESQPPHHYRAFHIIAYDYYFIKKFNLQNT